MDGWNAWMFSMCSFEFVSFVFILVKAMKKLVLSHFIRLTYCLGIMVALLTVSNNSNVLLHLSYPYGGVHCSICFPGLYKSDCNF